MDVQIKCGTKILNSYVRNVALPKSCMIFLCGGSVEVGNERFKEWQDNLVSEGIASISFNYSGVKDQENWLSQSSLTSRVKEAKCVTEWAKQNIFTDTYALYGVSMGGYIALALVDNMPYFFKKLILHAPAAYSSKAQDLSFGSDFTNEIRQKESWLDSPSFKWLEDYQEEVLLICSENDDVIPEPIITRYEGLIMSKPLSRRMVLEDLKHDVWRDNKEQLHSRNQIYKELLSFL